ncbi:formylglycine-generating enzyme family protein [Streptomyces pinistramenti]|uniref:formylglycine-generating enzyme family protein n=1 Tax=Streptomyces pinistramenti TaxID=2884812 RepID=UPI001D0740F9|nr:SUMF1/EgtB/PvdO family nonheme iron enzyme [Streptomyces pinistramenti]MCB5908101.1 formylglycine-generating enzyme family protein [Streptomyces pinistramenti]
MEWIRLPGGRVPAGEWHRAQPVAVLWWSATPLTADGLPLTGLRLDEAAELASELGGRIPTSAEWEWMAGGGSRRYPWGAAEPSAQHANLRASGPGHTTPVHAHPAGRTPQGLWDVAGNVWEWTTAPWRRDGIALLRGGSYHSLSQYAACAHDAPPGLRSPGIGLRLVRDTPPAPHSPCERSTS